MIVELQRKDSDCENIQLYDFPLIECRLYLLSCWMQYLSFNSMNMTVTPLAPGLVRKGYELKFIIETLEDSLKSFCSPLIFINSFHS